MYGPPSRITERDLELIDEIDQEDDAVDNEVDEATMTEDNVNTPMRGRRRRRPSDGAQRRQEQLRRQLEAAAVLILHDVFGGAANHRFGGHFYLKNDRFTKTGSGQIQGESC